MVWIALFASTIIISALVVFAIGLLSLGIRAGVLWLAHYTTALDNTRNNTREINDAIGIGGGADLIHGASISAQRSKDHVAS